jgi:hypothetical protein
MLTTNQVPSVIPYGWAMKMPSICCTKGYTI